MKTVSFEKIDYLECLELLEKLIYENKNYLIFATHPPVFTIGSDSNYEGIEAIRVDRGGSITYFDEGTLMVYFAFNVSNPPIFYKNIIKVFSNVFNKYSKNIYFDIKRPGFYIDNKKITSLGFKYKKNRSKHGVSIHLNPNLDNFNKIRPCNLDVKATSFVNEGIKYDIEELKKEIVKEVRDVFKTKS